MIPVACAGLFLLFGCSDLSTEEKGKTDSAEAIDIIECENPATCLHILKPLMNSEARTALPEFSQTSLNSFAYSLSGALSGKEQTVLGTYENLSSLLNDSLPCEEGVWNFTLMASRNGTILRGSLSGIEIRAGENQITFTLDWDKSALSGSGNLTFTLDYSEAGNADDVKLVTAELFSYNTTSHEETPLSGFAETPLTISNNSVTYQAEGLVAGNYWVKIYLYADEGKANLVNTWRELAIITGGQTSLASRKFTALNKVYEITYDLDGGQEVTANPLIRSYTRNTNTFTLPAPTRSGYAFGGWYKDADFTKLEGTFSEYVTCLTIPAQVTSLGFIDGAGIQRFKVASGNELFAVSGTVLCSKDLNTLYRWPPASPATVGTIPANIYSIADGAFANCRNIK